VRITFRLLEEDDLGWFGRWLADPDVDRWFHTEDLSPEGIAAKYHPRIVGEEPVEQWLAVIDDREVAWLQTYPIAVDAGYQAACTGVGVAPDAGGVDYLVGSAADRGRGLGPKVIQAFVTDIVFGCHVWPAVCAGAHPDNVRSWRALEKAGFAFAGLIETVDGPERLMACRRPEPSN
jgi:RimJ/RimL family protein N-acetyltransferase